MSLIDVKNALVKKTITNLEADVTRKGTWAYQNALALESVMSSDNMLNDLVNFSKDVRGKIVDAKKAIKVDYSFSTLKREIPNRFSDAVFVKEIDGELFTWSKTNTSLQILVSKDGGYGWETLVNIPFNSEDVNYEIDVLDITKIEEKYYIGFNSNYNGVNKIYTAEIIGGNVEKVEEVDTLTDAVVVGIKLFADKYGRLVTLYSVSSNSLEEVRLAVKNNADVVIKTSLNYGQESAVFGQDIYVDEDGNVYVALNESGKLIIAECDLTDEGAENISVNYFLSSLNEDSVDVNSMTSFVYGDKLYLVRIGGKIQVFDTKMKQFDVFSDLVLTAGDKIYPFIITENLEIVYKNKISTDAGKTWRILNIANTPIQESLSNLSKYGSFYKTYFIYQNEANENKLNTKKYITTIEEIKDTKISL